MRQPRVITTEDTLQAAVEDLLRLDHFALDIETTREGSHSNTLLWIGLGGPGRVYLIPVGHPKGIRLTPEHKVKTPAFVLYGNTEKGLTSLGKPSFRMVEHTVPAVYAPAPRQLTPSLVCKIIKPLLFSDRAKLGHNVKFDIGSLAKYYGEIPPGPYLDTIILRHLLDEDLVSYGLKELTCDWFRIPAGERTTFYPNLGDKGIENFGLDEAARYLAKDIRYCWLMYERWFPRLAKHDLERAFALEMEVYPSIMAMELAGFPIDLTKMDKVRADLAKQISAIEEACWKIAGDQFPLSNTNAKRWVLFGEEPVLGASNRVLNTLKLRVRSRTPKENLPQVTKGVLEYYATKAPLAQLLLDWSAAEKLRGTFIEGLTEHLHFIPDDLPRIHTSYKQHGTKTGRLSSSSPNLQQLPRGSTIRDLFVARPGYALIVSDYDQMELRCAAFLSGDTNMTQVFKDGRDIHAWSAAAMYRVPVEEVTPDQRQVGKTQSFGTLYGAEADKIAQVAHCSVERAEVLIKRYYREFPALEAWKEKELKLARARGDRTNPLMQPARVVIPPYGRQRRLPDLLHFFEGARKRAERQGINALVQGFAAYITKLAMIAVHERYLGTTTQMLAQVHDEIVMETKVGSEQEVLREVVHLMQSVKDPLGNPILGEVPLTASAHIGHSWAEAKG